MFKKVWDIPTRLFHWLLVILIIASYLTAEFGDVEKTYHKLSGYAILTLVIYRVFWGFFGSSTARFADFVKSPKTVFLYLKSVIELKSTKTSKPVPYSGHNPAGGMMVLALLLLIALQASLGLFASDDILAEGPLAHMVGAEYVNLATKWHDIIFDILMIFIGMHILAVFFYLFVKGENLIRPMFSGLKKTSDISEDAKIKFVSPLFALLLLLTAALLVWLLVNYQGL